MGPRGPKAQELNIPLSYEQADLSFFLIALFYLSSSNSFSVSFHISYGQESWYVIWFWMTLGCSGAVVYLAKERVAENFLHVYICLFLHMSIPLHRLLLIAYCAGDWRQGFKYCWQVPYQWSCIPCHIYFFIILFLNNRFLNCLEFKMITSIKAFWNLSQVHRTDTFTVYCLKCSIPFLSCIL